MEWSVDKVESLISAYSSFPRLCDALLTMSWSQFTLSELVLDCGRRSQRRDPCHFALQTVQFHSSMPTVRNDLLSELRDTDISRSQVKACLKTWLFEHAYSYQAHLRALLKRCYCNWQLGAFDWLIWHDSCRPPSPSWAALRQNYVQLNIIVHLKQWIQLSKVQLPVSQRDDER